MTLAGCSPPCKHLGQRSFGDPLTMAVNFRQRDKTCRFTLAEILGSYPQEASSFGPARGCNVDSSLPLRNNSAHISFTPTVTYSLTPGMTAVPGQTSLRVCPKLLCFVDQVTKRPAVPSSVSRDVWHNPFLSRQNPIFCRCKLIYLGLRNSMPGVILKR